MARKVTQKVIADHLDMSTRQVQRIINDGIFDQNMELDEIRVNYIRYLRSFACGKNQSPKAQEAESDLIPGTLDFERFRLTKAQADNMEIKNQVARAEVAPVEFIERVLLAASNEASGILDGLPLHIKRRHAGLSTEIMESIKEQVVKAQNAIARSDSALEPLLAELIEDVA